jgi:zinc D-Ala-D-Ala carboxypeptidase
MSRLFRAHPRRLLLAVIPGVVAALVVVGCRPPASAPRGASPVGAVASGQAPPRSGHREVPGELPRVTEGGHRGLLDVTDGEVPAGVSIFDDRYPAVAELDPRLLGALRRAATDAAHDGVRFYVDSGWRSRRYQELLFREAVATYGSAQQAARWVAPPGTSAHEAGHAVDLGPSSATAWLSARGASFGLCQIYANERWHYELRPAAVTQGCPAMYADPTQDPRMQQ